jgi:hypothetical protein
VGIVPGDLVVRRVRWSVASQQIGLVLGSGTEADTWLVMWSEGEMVKFDHHLGNALLAVTDETLVSVKERRCVASE